MRAGNIKNVSVGASTVVLAAFMLWSGASLSKNNLRSNSPLIGSIDPVTQARKLTQDIRGKGLSPDFEKQADEVSRAIRARHANANDRFCAAPFSETETLIDLRIAISEAKKANTLY